MSNDGENKPELKVVQISKKPDEPPKELFCEAVLEAARKMEYQDIIVIGIEKEGRLSWQSNINDKALIYWLLGLIKTDLVQN